MTTDGRTPRQKAAYHTLHNIMPGCRDMTEIGAQLDWTVKQLGRKHFDRWPWQEADAKKMAAEYRDLREVLRRCSTRGDFASELRTRLSGNGGTA